MPRGDPSLPYEFNHNLAREAMYKELREEMQGRKPHAGVIYDIERERQAGDVATPPDRLADLAKDENPRVRLLVACNASTPAGALAVLSKDPDEHVRSSVAFGESTPPDVLASMAGDPDWMIREIVAHNPSAPKTAISVLADDENESVRVTVAGRKDLDPSTIEHLTKDKAEEVRMHAIGNPNATVDLLVRIAIFITDDGMPTDKTREAAMAALQKRVWMDGIASLRSE